jgi:hypothetical protein
MRSFLRCDGVVLMAYALLAPLPHVPPGAPSDPPVPDRGLDDPALAWNLW